MYSTKLYSFNLNLCKVCRLIQTTTIRSNNLLQKYTHSP